MQLRIFSPPLFFRLCPLGSVPFRSLPFLSGGIGSSGKADSLSAFKVPCSPSSNSVGATTLPSAPLIAPNPEGLASVIYSLSILGGREDDFFINTSFLLLISIDRTVSECFSPPSPGFDCSGFCPLDLQIIFCKRFVEWVTFIESESFFPPRRRARRDGVPGGEMRYFLPFPPIRSGLDADPPLEVFDFRLKRSRHDRFLKDPH